MITQLSTREVYRNSWMTIREDVVLRPDGSEGIYGVIGQAHGAYIIPQEQDRLCLVQQYRYPVGRQTWEFPAGTLPNLAEVDPLELAIQELREETGLTAASMQKIGSFASAPGVSDQLNSVFLATDLSQGPMVLEIEEQGLSAQWFDRSEIEKMIKSGELEAATTIAAYGLLLLNEQTTH